MSVPRILGALFVAGASRFALAENAHFVIPFGGEPGAPLAHSYDYGTPPVQEGEYALRIPSVDPDIMAILPDVELTLDAASRTVKRAHADRAYRALDDCTKAQNTLRTYLQKALPQPYAGQGEAWQFQSADGKVVGGAYCELARYLPFPILRLDLALSPAAP